MKRPLILFAAAHLAVLQAHMEAVAARLGTKPVTVIWSDLEKKAAKMIPRPTDQVKAEGYGGYRKFIDQVPKEEKVKYPSSQFGAGDFSGSTGELQCLINGTHSILDIKKMLDAQFSRKSGLEQIMNDIQVLKLAGLVEIKETK
jgi:hypothetical protein